MKKNMTKQQKLNALRKELMNSYEYMKCANLDEFKQRLQWLSEGMLKNHITGDTLYVVNMKEIELYQEYLEKREAELAKLHPVDELADALDPLVKVDDGLSETRFPIKIRWTHSDGRTMVKDVGEFCPHMSDGWSRLPIYA